MVGTIADLRNRGFQGAVLIDELGNVAGGGTVGIGSASFTRPADTTPYASGDLVANSTTAGSVVPMSFTVARIADSSFIIRRARIKKTNTVTTNASFRLHLYKADPSASSGITNGDNGAWLTKEATYMGSMDVTCDQAYSDFSKGIGVPNEGTEISDTPAAGTQIIYGLLEARAAYTPTSGEIFSVVLEVIQN